ncbi:hypothetical protein XENTR_v10020793 [Xenopus tropicalis]|nr:hypothetical protein XENTR_v10020793 [Xenopus tropicalis]KAE8584028.1 hypothetical protein XENTR_v10020793 [Xenopus tropicalis]
MLSRAFGIDSFTPTEQSSFQEYLTNTCKVQDNRYPYPDHHPPSAGSDLWLPYNLQTALAGGPSLTWKLVIIVRVSQGLKLNS